MTWNQRVALVTGVTSGIGEATLKRFVALGVKVVGCGRRRDKLDALSDELGAAFFPVQGDAAQSSVIDAMWQACQEQFGDEPDLVVVNAGRGLGGSVLSANLDEFAEVLELNVKGALYLMQKAGQAMVQRQPKCFPDRAADIVVIGSVVGRNLSPFSAVYGSSKFAVHSLVEGLRREIGPKGVRVTLIEPGLVLSGFQAGAGYSDELVDGFKEKFGPLLYGDDIARSIEFAVGQPSHVHVGDILIRPTRQDYP
ncbi:SDR family oxidoreductase [Gilvimarinus sp. SDUM040013]|uniref:SDR family oxidoreductase n=1 Tax=Gilvimarinus gilvus TaxID=3058038 RepID=A0ABU4S2L9_9GAMM|nr:SDR family oxidoreductase [Gilvimarinus sp. SDUM040013]MDO3387235.1 SDR family oxidoreductase [Gilvimarinus sp. SDUM040013]MDX6851400.1 SDR family oxidoreductase [Gilvimarinus sp. SDUM040013]